MQRSAVEAMLSVCSTAMSGSGSSGSTEMNSHSALLANDWPASEID